MFQSMKAYNLLLILPLFFLLFACEKTEKDPISTFVAMKDGEKWMATSNRAVLEKAMNKFTISGTKEISEYHWKESLFFSFYLSDESESNTNIIHSFFLFVVGGDIISKHYRIDSTANNQIHIICLDTIKKQISGTFYIRLRLLDPEIEEYIQFDEGQFDINYNELDKLDSQTKK